MIKFAVGSTAYGTIPPIVDSAGLAITPTSVTAKTYKNGSTTATGDTVTILTYTDANGLRGWSYNPAAEVELDMWRIQIGVVIGGVTYYHTEMIQAVVVGVNVLSINSDTVAAANLAKSASAIVTGTVGVASSTTSVVTSACSPGPTVTDQFKGRLLIFLRTTTTTALRGQVTDITASSNSVTPTLTVTALTTSPVSGDTFIIV
jgi:hypothetical protein